MTRLLCVLVLMALAAAAPRADAHPLAPALLDLREVTAHQFDILWRTSTSRAGLGNVEPRLPDNCSEVSAPKAGIEDGEALVARWRVDCGAAGLVGKSIAASGLSESGINVILRIHWQSGGETKALLGPLLPALVVTPPEAEPSVFSSYLGLGVQHLLTGLDHVLFVLGLVLLVNGKRRLVATVTAFTVGHSLTLGLAALGMIAVRQAAAELAIAITVLVLACELGRSREASASLLRKKPWLMAGVFGLVHGLGFAGALAEVGLPRSEIVTALLGFNVGIEVGQILLVAALLLVVAVWQRRAPASSALARNAVATLIGSLAAFWCIERTVTMLG